MVKCPLFRAFLIEKQIYSILGFENIVKLLIENGADVNVTDKFGYSSLHYAIKGGNVDTVDTLYPHTITNSVISKWMTLIPTGLTFFLSFLGHESVVSILKSHNGV